MTGPDPLLGGHEFLSVKLFNSILCNPSHKLYRFLPSKNKCDVNIYLSIYLSIYLMTALRV